MAELCVGKTYVTADGKAKRRVTAIERGWVYFEFVGGWTISRPTGSIQVKHFNAAAMLLEPTVCECGHRADCHDGPVCGICSCTEFKDRRP